MKNVKSRIGYGFILTPIDFPDFTEEWWDEVEDSGYLHTIGIDSDMFFFGIIINETEDFVELDLKDFDRIRGWFDCLRAYEQLFPDADSFHSYYLIQEYE